MKEYLKVGVNEQTKQIIEFLINDLSKKIYQSYKPDFENIIKKHEDTELLVTQINNEISLLSSNLSTDVSKALQDYINEHKNNIDELKKIISEDLTSKIIIEINNSAIESNKSLKTISEKVDNFQNEIDGLKDSFDITNKNLQSLLDANTRLFDFISDRLIDSRNHVTEVESAIRKKIEVSIKELQECLIDNINKQNSRIEKIQEQIDAIAHFIEKRKLPFYKRILDQLKGVF